MPEEREVPLCMKENIRKRVEVFSVLCYAKEEEQIDKAVVKPEGRKNDKEGIWCIGCALHISGG